MVRKLLIATRNKKKKAELQTITRSWDVQVLTLDDIPALPVIEEDGATFADNAIKKACTIAQLSGFTTLADDSGLEVDALGGAPGIYSARWAGSKASDDENNRKLLAAMKNVAEPERTARFTCVIAVASPGGQVETAEGICEGKIGLALQGNGGFGYDPLFTPDGFDKTFAELSDTEKNLLSHRGRALGKAQIILQQFFAEGPA